MASQMSELQQRCSDMEITIVALERELGTKNNFGSMTLPSSTY